MTSPLALKLAGLHVSIKPRDLVVPAWNPVAGCVTTQNRLHNYVHTKWEERIVIKIKIKKTLKLGIVHPGGHELSNQGRRE